MGAPLPPPGDIGAGTLWLLFRPSRGQLSAHLHGLGGVARTKAGDHSVQGLVSRLPRTASAGPRHNCRSGRALCAPNARTEHHWMTATERALSAHMGAPVALAGGARRPRGHASVSCVGELQRSCRALWLGVAGPGRSLLSPRAGRRGTAPRARSDRRARRRPRDRQWTWPGRVTRL